jgi:hypothetical protein
MYFYSLNAWIFILQLAKDFYDFIYTFKIFYDLRIPIQFALELEYYFYKFDFFKK